MTLGLLGGLLLAPAVAQENASGVVRLERLQLEGTVIDASHDGAVLVQTGEGLAVLVPEDVQVRVTARKASEPTAVDLSKDMSQANVLPQREDTAEAERTETEGVATTGPNGARSNEDLDLAGEIASDDRSDTGIFFLRDPYARTETAEAADGDQIVANSGVDGKDVELEVGRSETGTEAAPVNRYDSRLSPGDAVTVTLPEGQADIVALENGLLTVRSESHGLLQLPVSALPQSSLRTVKVAVEDERGKNGLVSLEEAVQMQTRGRVSLAQLDSDEVTAWSPGMVEGGVIAESAGDRLLVVAPVKGKLQLVSVPPVLLAGQAVRLVERDGRVAVEHWAPVAESRPMGEIPGRADDGDEVREESNLSSPTGPQPEDPTDQRATDTYPSSSEGVFGTDDE